MNLQPKEADTLFDTALDVLNNIDNVMKHDGLIHLTISADLYEAFSDAVSNCIKSVTPIRRRA